jgi:ribosomal protein L11 methyltransferase
MFELHLTCGPQEVEELSFALWEAGTVGIREEDGSLIAGFADEADRAELAARLAAYEPHWERAADTDWVLATQQSWPGRAVGKRIFLSPVWNQDKTPPGRVRVIHNPGMASGTGEHPCTQLALQSLEQCVTAGDVVVDIGAGSGILALAALRLQARRAFALDTDWTSLACARENFQLNDWQPTLALGSAECIASHSAATVVANISGTVLLSLADELLRIVKPGGWLILTGFPENELSVVEEIFGQGEVTASNEWRCLRLRM